MASCILSRLVASYRAPKWVLVSGKLLVASGLAMMLAALEDPAHSKKPSEPRAMALLSYRTFALIWSNWLFASL